MEKGKEPQVDDDNDIEKKVIVPRKPSDVQRYKLEKLMKNPDKPVYIPEPREQKLPRVFNPPEFIRNIWGSSAGVGSGDFHIYRNIRRRQNAREKYQDKMSEKDQLDNQYADKVEENMKLAEERTLKKRSKRQKKKQNQKAKKSKTTAKKKESESESESETGEAEEQQTETGENVKNTDSQISDKQDNLPRKDSKARTTEVEEDTDSGGESSDDET